MPKVCDEATIAIPAELGWIVTNERHHVAVEVRGSPRIKSRERRKAEKTSVLVNGRQLTNACDVTLASPTRVERLEGTVEESSDRGHNLEVEELRDRVKQLERYVEWWEAWFDGAGY